MENSEDSDLERFKVPFVVIFPQSLVIDELLEGVSLKVNLTGGERVKVLCMPFFSVFI